MWRTLKLRALPDSEKTKWLFSISARTFGTNPGVEIDNGLVEDSHAQLVDETKVVICGGGVMGAAVAYHLALMGLGPRTVILESCRQVFKKKFNVLSQIW